MTTEQNNHRQDAPRKSGTAPTRRRFEDLPPAAQRALQEAEARRTDYEKKAADMPAEIGGRGGKEPVRYGDYEVKGVAVDF